MNMLKLKYLASPGAKTNFTALTFSLKFLVYFLEKKSHPKIHPDVTTSCYRTMSHPAKIYKPNFISAQLPWYISDQTAFIIEGRNVRLHVAPDKTNGWRFFLYENRSDLRFESFALYLYSEG